MNNIRLNITRLNTTTLNFTSLSTEGRTPGGGRSIPADLTADLLTEENCFLRLEDGGKIRMETLNTTILKKQ